MAAKPKYISNIFPLIILAIVIALDLGLMSIGTSRDIAKPIRECLIFIVVLLFALIWKKHARSGGKSVVEHLQYIFILIISQNRLLHRFSHIIRKQPVVFFLKDLRENLR